jgi:hypothetical protein
MEGHLHPLQEQEISDDLLFHYASGEKLGMILNSEALWLSPYSGTNDPRENKEWVAQYTMPSSAGRPSEKYLGVTQGVEREADAATDRFLRRGARLACFTKDRQRTEEAGEGTLFHRGWARARMWEQYADHHAGACLVFSFSEFINLVHEQVPHGDGDFLAPGTVRYLDKSLSISLSWIDVVDEGIEATIDKFQTERWAGNDLYFTKNRDWESEREFRIVCSLWNVQDGEEDNPIPIAYGSSLKGIVLGERFAESEMAAIAVRVDAQTELGVVRCEWHSGVPTLTSVGTQREDPARL